MHSMAERLRSMPKVFEIDGFKFFFFSNEGNPQEPCHIHVRKGNGLAKFWVRPDVRLESSAGFSAKELRFIESEVEKNIELIEEAWNEFFY